jgi:hypothetical protein
MVKGSSPTKMVPGSRVLLEMGSQTVRGSEFISMEEDIPGFIKTELDKDMAYTLFPMVGVTKGCSTKTNLTGRA